MSEQTKKNARIICFIAFGLKTDVHKDAHTLCHSTHICLILCFILRYFAVCVCALLCSSRLFLCPSVFVSVSLVLRVLLLLLLFGFLLLPLLSAYGALLLFFFTCLLAYSFARSSVVLVCNIPAMWFCRNLERQKDNDNVVREREQRKTESLCWMS